MFSNTCRLCLADSPEYDIFSNRISTKIMTLLSGKQLASQLFRHSSVTLILGLISVEVEEGDKLPNKVCSDCRMKIETLYVFKAKTLESDAALRKLLQTTGRGTDKRISDSVVSISFALYSLLALLNPTLLFLVVH